MADEAKTRELKDHEPLLRDLLLASVLRALTPFIPVPFLDGIAEGVLATRIYATVARVNGREFTRAELNALCDEGGGCLSGCRGCFFDLVLWPLKSIRLVKILVFTPIEYKKVVDRASRSFVQAYIVNHIVSSGKWPDGQAELVAGVRDEVCAQVGTGPVEHLFQLALEGTGRKLQEAFELLLRTMKRVARVKDREREAAVTRALDDIEDEQKSKLNPLLEALVKAVRQLPGNYLADLRRVTEEKLEIALQPPAAEGAS